MSSASESISQLMEYWVERALEARFADYLAFLTKRLLNLLTGYLEGGVNDFRKRYGVRAILNYQSDVEVPTVTLRIEVTIPPEEVERLRRIYYRKVREDMGLTRLRIDAIFRVLTYEALKELGGPSAVLPGLRPGTPEGADKA
jgi:hypothetical protein